jgi:hypothetical protein
MVGRRDCRLPIHYSLLWVKLEDVHREEAEGKDVLASKGLLASKASSSKCQLLMYHRGVGACQSPDPPTTRSRLASCEIPSDQQINAHCETVNIEPCSEECWGTLGM